MTTRNTINLCTLISLLALAGCGGSSSTNTTTTGDSGAATDITDVELTARDGSCANYVGTYDSSVTDVQRGIGFTGNLSITSSGNTCTFTSNDIPNHDFNQAPGNFATPVIEVSKSFTLPSTPSTAASVTELEIGVVNAIMLNGVVLDILPAACYGEGNEPLGQEKIGCGAIDHPWRYDPMSTLNNFGTDSHNAHVQPDGSYHYHGNPVALFAQDCSTATAASPVIGFAADGFPIFGSCIEDGNGGIRQVTSSYSLKNGGGAREAVNGYQTPTGGTGNIASDNYDGQFRGDYEYVADQGDLDECNGMTVNNQYGYYVTNSFPWIVGCFKGSVDSSFEPRNARDLEIKMHGHDHF